MYIPLVVLAVLAVVSGWRVWPTSLSVTNLLEQARPLGTAEGISRGVWWPEVVMPAEHLSHAEAVHTPVSYMAFAMAMTGFVLATLFYGVRTLDAEDARRQFASIYRFVRAKWWFDELYDAVFVRPALAVSRAVAAVDRGGIDWLADHLAFWCRSTANFDDLIDRLFVDGAVNGIARWTYRAGLRLRAVQTGRLRQYVMWIAVGIVGLFVLVSWYWSGS